MSSTRKVNPAGRSDRRRNHIDTCDRRKVLIGVAALAVSLSAGVSFAKEMKMSDHTH